MLNKIILLVMTMVTLTSCGSGTKNNPTEPISSQAEQSLEVDQKETSDEAPRQGEDTKELDSDKEDGKKTIAVTTTFIEDMVEELIGDKAHIELIIPAGSDPHLYTAKPEDYSKLTSANLVLYHGIHFEGKMNDALEEIGYALASTFDDREIGEMDDDDQPSGKVSDPHFWFDIDLYKEAFTNAAEKLKELYSDDSSMVEAITANHDAYMKKLDDLDEYNKKRLEEIPEDSRYLITPHDAFNYFARRYNIEVRAPQGVSTDSEISNKDLEDTANFIVDHKIKAIFAESTTNPERMEKLRDVVASKGFETKVIHGEGQELFSDSLASKGEPGDNFIDMYKHNVDLIVDNLK